MQIQLIRNATLILQSGDKRLLVDPMLGGQGSFTPLAFLRYRPARNPTVPLPLVDLGGISCGLITHCQRGHLDHLDAAGTQYLVQHKLPVYCNYLDERYLQRRGIQTIALKPRQPQPFYGGTITPFPTAHGYGLIGKLMGHGVGYLIQLPGEPSLYISGDTVLTPTVKQVLTEYQPEIAVFAAGAAQLDIGKPILMPLPEMLEFIRLAPGRVIATHLEALNHCPMTRDQLRIALEQAGLLSKVAIPLDGECLNFTA